MLIIGIFFLFLNCFEHWKFNILGWLFAYKKYFKKNEKTSWHYAVCIVYLLRYCVGLGVLCLHKAFIFTIKFENRKCLNICLNNSWIKPSWHTSGLMSEVTLFSPRKITSTDNSLNKGFKRRSDLISQTASNTGLNTFR